MQKHSRKHYLYRCWRILKKKEKKSNARLRYPHHTHIHTQKLAVIRGSLSEIRQVEESTNLWDDSI